jgi:hypothetical protein
MVANGVAKGFRDDGTSLDSGMRGRTTRLLSGATGEMLHSATNLQTEDEGAVSRGAAPKRLAIGAVML